MPGLIDELAVEAEVARQHDEDVLVFEPGHVIDDEPHRDAVDAERSGRSHAERERTDASGRDDGLSRRRDPVVREPADRHSGFREFDGVVLHAEVDLACGAPFPRHHAGVAEADRHACGRTGRQRHERGSVHDGAVEGESTSVVRQRRQHDRGSASGDDERHDEETRDETEDLGSSVVRIERLRRVCHAVMERWDTSRRHG